MRSAIVNAKRIVVKVGSSTLCYANGHLNLERIERLVRQLSDLANQGKEVILVSSGATGAGLAPLGFKEKPRDLVLKQAAAAVGQGILIHMYERMFREYGRTVGQILLTKEDSTGRHSYLNLRNTLHTLLQLNVIPIINENDVVAIEEFKIGDNDTLSATVAGIVDADLLIILSDIEGLYRSIDCLLLPTVTREAFGLVICEAMYCGVPVITSGSGAQREIIEDGISGFIVDPLNEHTLQQAVEHVMSDAVDLSSIITNARRVVEERFIVNRVADELVAIIDNLHSTNH